MRPETAARLWLMACAFDAGCMFGEAATRASAELCLAYAIAGALSYTLYQIYRGR